MRKGITSCGYIEPRSITFGEIETIGTCSSCAFQSVCYM